MVKYGQNTVITNYTPSLFTQITESMSASQLILIQVLGRNTLKNTSQKLI